MKSSYPLHLFFAAVLFLALGSAAVAQEHGGRHEMGERMISRLAERLDLDETEAGQMAEILRGHHEAIAPTMDGLRNAQQALQEQIAGETFDENAIRARAAEVAEFQADLAVARALHAQELRGLLSPEQFQRFQEMHERRDHAGMDRRGPGQRRDGRRHGR